MGCLELMKRSDLLRYVFQIILIDILHDVTFFDDRLSIKQA